MRDTKYMETRKFRVSTGECVPILLNWKCNRRRASRKGCEEVTKNFPKKVIKIDQSGNCPKCYYKIQVVVRPKRILMNDSSKRSSDFHFYRQNPDGGNTPVQNNVTDPVIDTHNSDYTTDCGTYCVPEGGVNVD